jgi:anti-anti-sigma factor
MEKNSNPSVRVETVDGSRPGVAVIKVYGPLEITNYGEFEELMRRNESPVLLVDLAEVPYIDSAVLGSMVAMHVACARNQRKYALVNANQRIQNMLTVSGVGEIIVSFTTVAQAESALAR